MSKRWSVPHGTVVEDQASGLRVEFHLSESGLRTLMVSRCARGLPGMMARDLDLDADGKRVGAGSPLGTSGLPLNPVVREDGRRHE